jgi:hypothetical protein
MAGVSHYRLRVRAGGERVSARSPHDSRADTVGRNHAPLHLNALTPPRGVEFEEWADALSDIISTSYLLMQRARNVLNEALLRARQQHG